MSKRINPKPIKKRAVSKLNKNKILIISIIAVVIVVGLIFGITLAVKNRGPAEDATLAEVKTNGFHELVFVMSDGTEVNAGALPSNHEGIQIISAKRSEIVSVGTSGATEEIRIVCEDDENRTYELVWNIPKFGKNCSLKTARISYQGVLVFTVKQNGETKEIKQGNLLKLSTPAKEMTPSGASDYATDESLDKSQTVYIDMKIKGYGTVTLALDRGAAPKTVDAFLKLVSEKYYDGLTFNKIFDEEKYKDDNSFVLGGISSKSADKVEGEFANNGYSGNYLSHKYGTLSLYHGDDMNGATSEFFICTADNTDLDGKYAAFGYVVSGMNIIEKLAELTGTFSEYDGIKSSELEKYRAKQATIESITVKESN